MSRLSAISMTPITSRLRWEGGQGAAGLAPLGRAGYAHVPDANTGGQPIQTTTVIMTCVYDGWDDRGVWQVD